MIVNCFHTHVAEIVDRDAEPNSSRDVRGSRFELVREILPGCAGSVYLFDHLSSTKERRHVFEVLALSVENPNASRAHHLVPRERHEVAIQVSCINTHVWNGLCSVHKNQCSKSMGGSCDFFDRVYRAEHVGGMRYAYDLCSFINQFVNFVLSEVPFLVYLDDFAPLSLANCCHGTILLWCSIIVRTILSPCLMFALPQA